MTGNTFNNQDLIQFLQDSPTPFHAVLSMSQRLQAAGFVELNENEDWSLQPGGKYFVVRSGTAIAAFIHGVESSVDHGIRVVGAHTDSPCLKVKPMPSKLSNGYQQLSIEVYGGVLLAPWFDRDLSLAGRVVYRDTSGALKSALINFKRAIGSVPSLAIHLDRAANEGRKINPHVEMDVVLGQSTQKLDFKLLLQEQMQLEGYENIAEILDFNLSFYDVQPPAVLGLNNEFLASARLDNLLSCYIGINSLIQADTTYTSVVICNDHEEVGSRSEVGAQGPMLKDVLSRINPDPQANQKAIRRSLMLSVDNAHGIHPNYASKHDENHGPIINAGPVIKFDACQGYATNSDSAAFVRWLATKGEPIALQSFVMRADMRCGSTIGPITATELGIQTVDIGLATFGMHSVRELGGVKDGEQLNNLLVRFMSTETLKL